MTEQTPVPVALDDEIEAMDPQTIERELARVRRKLTVRQRQWIAAIPAHDFKPWAAGLHIGIGRSTMWSWFRNAAVVRCLKLSQRRHLLELDINEARIMLGYEREERADIRKLLDPKSGNMLPPGEWPDDIARCVTEYGFDKNGDPYVKLADQRGARDRLAKFQKMFVERHEVTGKDGAPLQSQAPIVNVIIGGIAAG